MTNELDTAEANTLAQRIINTMRPTPALTDWVEELEGLNTDRAWRIFRTLRSQTEHGLTIAAFAKAYRTDLDHERRNRTAPNTCQLCDGTGWVECDDDRRHADYCIEPDTCRCHAVVPCQCTRGQQATHTHQSILEANRR